MIRSALRRVAVACLLLLAACLEFDGQDVSLRYDEAADRIDLHLVYRGLYAGGGADAVDKALQQLNDARRDGTFALWQNWPFQFAIPRNNELALQTLLAHVDVENGGLFTDPTGALCAHQFVRIRDAKAFVQQVNTLLDVWVAGELANGTKVGSDRHRWDADTRDLVREFARSGQHLVALRQGSIELRLPLSAHDHAWLRASVFRNFAEAAGEEALRSAVVAERRAEGGAPAETTVAASAKAAWTQRAAGERVAATAAMRFLAANEGSFAREPERTRITFGVAGQRDLALTKAADGLYHPQLLAALREGNAAIEDNVPDQELARRFDAFTQRAAVLPPAVATVRAAKPPAATGGR
ncbi:MAG: hypothetical protein ACK6D1_08975 [Planctomycetota bacterium]